MHSFHDLRLYISDAAWSALEALAREQKTDPRLLASHAVEQYASLATPERPPPPGLLNGRQREGAS